MHREPLCRSGVFNRWARGGGGEAMAQETRWKGTVAAVLAGGAIGVFLAPVVAPAFARLMRPATKAAIKAGRAIYHRGMETAAELRETIEDVTAEIEAEAAAAGPA